MTEKSTVRSVTFDLVRSLGLTSVFGNPGSTEQPFLQEASVIAMADPFAQVTRRPKRRLGRGCRPGREVLWTAAQHRLPIV